MKYTAGRIAAALVLTAIGAIAGCSEPRAGSSQVERSDSAGIEIVRNLGADRPLAWEFTPVLQLGGADDGPEAFFQVQGRIGTNPAGEIYVLDGGNYRVRVFDSDGQHLRSFGRQGGGPGEMEFPIAMSVSPDGAVSVFDAGKMAYIEWAADGAHSSNESVDGFIRKFAFTAFGRIQQMPLSPDDPVILRHALMVVSPDGSAGDTLVVLEQPRPEVTDLGCVALRVPPVFTPQLEWATSGNRVAYTAEAGYVIGVWDGDDDLSIRRAIQPRTASAELAASQITQDDGFFTVSFGSGSCRVPGEEAAEKFGFAPVVPVISMLSTAPDGSIWVRRTAISDGQGPIDVFDGTGAYIGTLPPESPFPLAFTPEGEVITVEKNDLDVERVVVYRIRDSGV